MKIDQYLVRYDMSVTSFSVNHDVYKMLYVKGCQVRKVLFPVGKSGQWLNNAYVILSSAEDIEKVHTNQNRLSLGASTMKGRYLEVFKC